MNVEIQNATTAKRELNEYELRNIRLQDEINLLQRDKDHLTGHITTLQQKVNLKQCSYMTFNKKYQMICLNI